MAAKENINNSATTAQDFRKETLLVLCAYRGTHHSSSWLIALESGYMSPREDSVLRPQLLRHNLIPGRCPIT